VKIVFCSKLNECMSANLLLKFFERCRFVEYPSTNFIIILFQIMFERLQSTRLIHIGYMVVSSRRVTCTTFSMRISYHIYITHRVVLSLRVNLLINITHNIYTYVKTC